jgi:hypothetical protein
MTAMAKPIISADSHVTEHPDAYRKFAAAPIAIRRRTCSGTTTAATST